MKGFKGLKTKINDMNREIKFRVWANCDEGMKMVYLDKCTFDNGLWFPSDEHIDEYRKNIMQYTGLTDKNGKEIYEGDVVKLSEDWHFKEFQLCVIEYHQFGIPYIIQRYLKNETGHGNYNFDYMKDSTPKGIESYYEIIGNIYENPELLK
jgi:uncharacterized phage protein (TIGR01671 family)